MWTGDKMSHKLHSIIGITKLIFILACMVCIFGCIKLSRNFFNSHMWTEALLSLILSVLLLILVQINLPCKK